MVTRSLKKLLLCLVLVIATVGMATASGPELMVYSGTIPQGVNQGDGSYEISFSIYASEQGGNALWTETQNVYVYHGTFAVYLGAVQKLNLAFDMPYWVGVKTGEKEDIWPLTGAGYSASVFRADPSAGNAAITPELVVADEVKSANIKEADGTTGQNTNSGSGIKTNHIQNAAVTAAKIAFKAVNVNKIADNAVTTPKIAANAVTTTKIAAGAVTDSKITGPISASKISSTGLNADNLDGLDSTAFVTKSGATMTGPLDLSIAAGPTFPKALHITGIYGALGVGRSIVFGDITDYVRLRDVVETSGQVGFSIDTAGNQSRLYIKHGGNVGVGTSTPDYKLDIAGPANLNKGLSSGAALLVNNAEALWYNGTYFSWGYGGSTNYFARPVGIGTTNVNLAKLQVSHLASDSTPYGVYGRTEKSGQTAGVVGANYSGSSSGIGVWAYSSGGGYALYANYGGSGYAGYFAGPVHVNGTLSKSAGSFKIDHPTDPENKYLSHSFVESPDMMNIYNGIVLLDDKGAATVKLPEWFGALNRDFRYQLTCIGSFAPVYVAREISDNQFMIAGGSPGMKVSWQVTGIRQDVYANAHRIQVEEEKPLAERGSYLHPALFGQPVEKSVIAPGRP